MINVSQMQSTETFNQVWIRPIGVITAAIEVFEEVIVGANATVGPNRVAVGNNNFSVWIGNKCEIFDNPRDAARCWVRNASFSEINAAMTIEE